MLALLACELRCGDEPAPKATDEEPQGVDKRNKCRGCQRFDERVVSRMDVAYPGGYGWKPGEEQQLAYSEKRKPKQQEKNATLSGVGFAGTVCATYGACVLGHRIAPLLVSPVSIIA